MKYILSVLLVALFMSFSIEYSEVKKVSVKTFQELVKSNKYKLIDVRTPNEFKDGHIEGAININFYSQDFQTEIMKFMDNEAILIYCRSGARSGSATQKLAQNGFNTIYDLQGGIIAYLRAGHKLIK